MSRPRRPISPSGFLQCSKCREVKHLADFNVQNSNVTWFIDRWGAKWGKPSSQCKECMRAYHINPAGTRGLTPAELEKVGLSQGLTDDDTFDAPDPLKGYVPMGPPAAIGETSKPDPVPSPHPADDPNWLTPEAIAALNNSM